MARSWQYSRYRRAIMQGVMWVVLGATVGLAGLQARQRTSVTRLSMSMNVYVLGAWHIRVPDFWAPVEQNDKVMDFREPVNPEARSFEEEGGRELVVEQDVVSPRMTSTSYLARKLHLEALANPKPIPMCGRPGVMVILQGVDGDEDGTSVIAGVVLPDGAAITLLLRVPRSLTAGDAALAETIASTITYQPTNNQPDRDPDAIQKPEDPGNPQDTE